MSFFQSNFDLFNPLFLTWVLTICLMFLLNNLTDSYGGIHYAIEKGDIEKVKKYLERGVGADYKKNNGYTPLYIASVKGQVEIVKLLIAYGATVNQGIEEENGINPLLAAVIKSHQDVIDCLMTYGAISGIHIAAFQGKVKKLIIYLERGGEVNSIRNGKSLLHLAVLGNQKKVVRLLLNHAADINICDLNGEAPLYEAVEKNYMDIVELLIERGANMNQNGVRGSPLHLAIRLKHPEIIALLVTKGADVNMPASTSGASPLHDAAQLNLPQIANLLLANGAKVNVRSKIVAETPLHLAVRKGNLVLAELLIAHGANVNSKSLFGATPLSQARGNREMTELLIAHGATDYGWQD